MKKLILVAVAATAAATAAHGASAQTIYANIGASADSSADNFGATGRLGYDLPGFLSVEGEANYFFDADVATLTGFGRAEFAVAPAISVHGRAGYGVATDFDNGDDYFAYGAGGSFAVSERSRLRADYTVYNGGGASVDDGFFSLTYVMKFTGAR